MLQETKGALKGLLTTFYFDNLEEISFCFRENLYVSL